MWSLERSGFIFLFLSIGTERNKFRPNGPSENSSTFNRLRKSGIADFLTGPTEILNLRNPVQFLVMAVAGTSTGSSRSAFFVVFFVLRTYTFIHLY